MTNTAEIIECIQRCGVEYALKRTGGKYKAVLGLSALALKDSKLCSHLHDCEVYEGGYTFWLLMSESTRNIYAGTCCK
jgi:hypothetical protein